MIFKKIKPGTISGEIQYNGKSLHYKGHAKMFFSQVVFTNLVIEDVETGKDIPTTVDIEEVIIRNLK